MKTVKTRAISERLQPVTDINDRMTASTPVYIQYTIHRHKHSNTCSVTITSLSIHTFTIYNTNVAL